MFKRAHHQTIHQLLGLFDAQLLLNAECYFAGGTAIALLLNEYRESVDVDFLCASKEGYRYLRNCVTQQSLGNILTAPINHLREVRADRDGIRTFLEINNTPIKVEIVFEARIPIHGELNNLLKVPVLDIHDMFAEKLLANCDRGADSSTVSRDIIDLAMLIIHYGDIPQSVWRKVTEAYGQSVVTAFQKSVYRLSDALYLKSCFKKMDIAQLLAEDVLIALQRQVVPT